MNHYEVLGIPPAATTQQVKEAYRREAMKWHPDRHEGAAAKGEADRRFKDLAVAYRTLSNSEARASYDQQLEQELQAQYQTREKEQTRQRHAQQTPPQQDYADTGPQFEEETASSDEANQMFFEQMLNLASELADRGFPEFNIFKALIALGCPEPLAKTVAANVHKSRKPNNQAAYSTKTDPRFRTKEAKSEVASKKKYAKSAGMGSKVVSLISLLALCIVAAAVAIPAFEDYTRRANIASGLATGSDAAEKVTIFYSAYQKGPDDLNDAGFSLPSSKTIKDVTLDNQTGIISVNFRDNFFWNKSLILVPKAIENKLFWLCTTDGIPEKYLPSSCKATQIEANERLVAIGKAAKANAELQKEYDQALTVIEKQYPELNPDSPQYNSKQLDWVANRKSTFQERGQDAVTALRSAIADYKAATQAVLSSAALQRSVSQDSASFFGGSGEVISMNFQNIEVRSLFQIFADISGSRFSVDSQVRKSVNIRFASQPWTQALTQFLQQNQLAIIKVPNGYYIFPSSLSDESAYRRAGQASNSREQSSGEPQSITSSGSISQEKASQTICQTWPSAC